MWGKNNVRPDNGVKRFLEESLGVLFGRRLLLDLHRFCPVQAATMQSSGRRSVGQPRVSVVVKVWLWLLGALVALDVGAQIVQDQVRLGQYHTLALTSVPQDLSQQSASGPHFEAASERCVRCRFSVLQILQQ